MLVKYSNIKFNKNPSFRGRFAPCVHTNMTKLIVVFAICERPKNRWLIEENICSFIKLN